MAKSISIPAPPPSLGSLRDLPWLFLVVLTAVWLIALNQLRVEWTINPQYSYGWAVPCLALYLFWDKWKTRPPLERPVAPAWVLAAMATLAFCILLVRMIQEANPEWRMITGLLAVIAAGITLLALLYAGGWMWLRHFAFPVLFVLVSVPWPMGLELQLLEVLMRFNAAISVESLAWFGIPSTQMGNIIRLSTGAVGVEEACSGIRSLQTTIMIALFLGELHRLSIPRRLVMLAAGLLIAAFFNIARTLTLVFLTADHGTGAVDKWHDAIGFSVLVLSFLALWGLGNLLRKGSHTNAHLAELPPDQVGQPRRLPVPFLIAMAAWFLLVEAGTETWYQVHEAHVTKAPDWYVDWPVNSKDFETIDIPERTYALLQYHEGAANSWIDGNGSQWVVYFLRWYAGKAAPQLANAHRPEICLPAAGLTLVQDLGVQLYTINGIVLPIQRYVFRAENGQPVHVFYCVREDGELAKAPPIKRKQIGPADRIQAVLAGRRSLGQRVLEIAMVGYPTIEEAENALLSGLRSIVRGEIARVGNSETAS
jgi:exosortase